MAPDDQENREPVLLSLFLEELSSLTRILFSELREATEELPRERIDALTRAVRAIRGAARVVGLPLAANLAYAMEESLVHSSLAGGRLMPPHIEQLRHAAEVFQAIQAQEVKSIHQWLLDQEAPISRIAQALRQATAGTENPSSGQETEKASEPERPMPCSEPEVEDTAEGVSMTERSPSVTGSLEKKHVSKLPKEGSGEKDFYNDHVLGLAGECLMLARRLRDLEPSLREAITGSSGAFQAGTTDWADLSDDTEMIPAMDTLTVFERSSRRLEELESRLYDEILAGRTIPFADRMADIPHEIDALAEKLGKAVHFHLEGGETAVDPTIAEKLQKLLRQLIHQVLIHSMETPVEREAAGKSPDGLLSLSASSKAGMLYVTLTDDGRGLHEEDVSVNSEKFAVVSSNEMTSESDTIDALIESLDGTIHWAGGPGEGTRILLIIPAVSFYLNCFLVAIDGESYALPIARIAQVTKVPLEDIRQDGDRRFFALDGENIALFDVGQIMKSSGTPTSGDDLSIVVLRKGQISYGLVVEGFLDEERLVLQPLDPRLGKVEFVRAAALLADGSPTLVLDVNDVLRALEHRISERQFSGAVSSQGSVYNEQIKDRTVENIPWPFWRRQ